MDENVADIVNILCNKTENVLKVKTGNVQCRKGGTLLAGGTTSGGTQLVVGTTRRHMRTR